MQDKLAGAEFGAWLSQVDGRSSTRAAERTKRSLLVIGRDDESGAGHTCEYLAAGGFQIAVAGDGVSGLASAFQGEFDIILLDTSARGVDGVEVLRQLRQRIGTPVIVLAEPGDAAERIEALEAGADDYLEEPFARKELLARLCALLRRVSVEPPPCRGLRIGDLTLHQRTRVVDSGGARITLSATETELLAILMRAAGRVVSRDEFAVALYQRRLNAYERSVDIRISQLRKKLARVGARNVVRTVRGIGYLFILDAPRSRY
jgi:two-component system response regulator CpxR